MKPEALAQVAPKIEKLVRLLGSDKDGEIVGAVLAIKRTLESVGLDLHSLAEFFRAPARLVADNPRNWRQVAVWCLHCGVPLTDKERGFLDDMQWRLVGGGDPTERQRKWLRHIYADCRKEKARAGA